MRGQFVGQATGHVGRLLRLDALDTAVRDVDVSVRQRFLGRDGGRVGAGRLAQAHGADGSGEIRQTVAVGVGSHGGSFRARLVLLVRNDLVL
jgi:hypothetical protein